MPEPETQAPETLPTAQVAHALPGRTRLLFAARRGDAAWFSRVEAALRAQPGVRAAIASPRIGSLVIHHDVGCAPDGGGLFRVAQVTSTVAVPSRRGTQRGRKTVQPLRLAAGGLAGLGVIQVLRGRGAGSAVEAFWGALHVRRQLGMPRLAPLLVGVGLVQVARGEILGSGLSLLIYALTARHWTTGRRRRADRS